jgi:C-terminal processing protease CtpA/Prc
MSGLRLRAEGQDFSLFKISRVISDSPAVEAGLDVGDIIIAAEPESIKC